MGHANLSNISKITNHLLHHGSWSIREITDELIVRKQTVHASEGECDEEYMLSYATEMVMMFLREKNVVEPIKLSGKQRKILKEWDSPTGTNDWDSGDDGKSGEYGILDSIKWKALKPRLPILENFEN